MNLRRKNIFSTIIETFNKIDFKLLFFLKMLILKKAKIQKKYAKKAHGVHFEKHAYTRYRLILRRKISRSGENYFRAMLTMLNKISNNEKS